MTGVVAWTAVSFPTRCTFPKGEAAKKEDGPKRAAAPSRGQSKGLQIKAGTRPIHCAGAAGVFFHGAVLDSLGYLFLNFPKHPNVTPFLCRRMSPSGDIMLLVLKDCGV
jgi:hypothetical protein